MTKTIAKAMAVALLITSVLGLASSAAAQSSPAHKMTGQVVPAYWYGYWPGNPTLCVLDQTDGLPVAEAVAEFDHTVVDLEVRDICGDSETVIIHTDTEPSDYAAYTNGADDGGYAADGMWVQAGVVWMSIYADHEMTREDWRRLLVHELGHAIGLDHTVRHDSIMNVDRIYQLDGLTQTDLAVLERLYSASA